MVIEGSTSQWEPELGDRGVALAGAGPSKQYTRYCTQELQSTDQEKSPALGRQFLRGAGGMRTIRWTRGLLLVGGTTHHSYTQTENIKQLRVACSECTCTVFCGCCDNILDSITGDLKMSSVRKQGKTVHSEAREVTASVVKLCDEEARRKQLTFPLTRAIDRAARHMGVSAALIKKVRRESKHRDEKGHCHRYTRQGNTGLTYW
jgi:hypothetical protein